MSGQAQDEVRAGVVLRDLVDHGAVAAAAGLPADEVLAVDKVCRAPAVRGAHYCNVGPRQAAPMLAV